jgi:hypothetical protein
LGASSAMLDLTDMVVAANITPADLCELCICPQLEEYRCQLRRAQQNDGALVAAIAPRAGETTDPPETYVGILDPKDFVGRHGCSQSSSGSTSALVPPTVVDGAAVGYSRLRDPTAVPFAAMTEAEKANTLGASNSSAAADFGATSASSSSSPRTDTPVNCIAGPDLSSDGGDAHFLDMGCDDDDNDFIEPLEGDDCDAEGNYVPSVRRASMSGVGPVAQRASMLRQSLLGNGQDTLLPPGEHEQTQAGGGEVEQRRVQWEALTGSAEVPQELLEVPVDANEHDTAVLGVAGAAAAAGDSASSEYAFFDVNTLLSISSASSNNWAGAAHWKWGGSKMGTFGLLVLLPVVLLS